MKTRGSILFSAFLAIVLLSCAPSRFVKPLAKGQRAVSASFGGPTILFSGAVIPMPFTTICYAQGLSNQSTAFASLHITSGLFGNIQSDLGATFRLFEREKVFGVSVSPALQLAYSIGNQTGLRVWPSLDANVYLHPFKTESYAYLGANSWFELSRYKAHGEVQQLHSLPSIQLGYVFVRKLWQHQVEAKYLGMGLPNLPNVVSYVGAGGKGSFGIYYTIIRLF
ncbi:MAG TPA: hypothetical protein PLQ93_01545 [Bacteroidia bacterium]|nr:hypothetical protein [Bacteroidia bacterium]